MAHIRYQIEFTPKPKFEHYTWGKPGDTYGMTLLETPPQTKTLFTGSNRGRYTLNLPYLIQMVCYTIRKDGKYLYSGIYNRGLQTFFSNRSLTSFQNHIHYAPTDLRYPLGIVCTNHDYDHTTYNSVSEILNLVTDMWYGAVQPIDSIFAKNWEAMSQSEVLEYDWGQGRELSIREALSGVWSPHFNSVLWETGVDIPANATLLPIREQKVAQLKLAGSN